MFGILDGIRNRVSAALKAVGKPGSGMSLQALEMTTRMQVDPSEGGRSVTKCTPRCDHGHSGMGRGRRLPAGSRKGTLAMAHLVHPWTKRQTSHAIWGHQ